MQRLAMFLIGGGVGAALGYFLWWFITTSDIALFWRIVIGIVIIGFVLILTSVGWDRYRALKGKDKDFKGVKY